MASAIVTGASRGLGLALASELARRGRRLVVDARGEEELESGRARLGALTEVVALPGDVATEAHRRALMAAAGPEIELLVNNASGLGLTPLPQLERYPLAELEELYRVNVLAPLRLFQLARPLLAERAVVINITSDAAVEAYEGWGGYGSSKAALEQLTRVLGAEHPDLRIYSVDPGDMRTRMHQDAFPGEDISDRPPPEESVPGLIALIEGELPSGRYRASELAGLAA
jgi:NAD(P)-dependent dehydrogenase (short-subunit alcohol dehydrogenase family)